MSCQLWLRILNTVTLESWPFWRAYNAMVQDIGSVLWTFGRWRTKLWKPLTFHGYMWTLIYFSICGWGREYCTVPRWRERGGLAEGVWTRPAAQLRRTKSRDQMTAWSQWGGRREELLLDGWGDGSRKGWRWREVIMGRPGPTFIVQSRAERSRKRKWE